MSIYLKHYWTLYKEFIDIFQHLTYHNIPIALLTNFYQQIDDKLKRQMENEQFQSELTIPLLEQNQIQPYFDHWMDKIKKNDDIKKEHAGKILVHYNYSRISEWTYRTLFDPAKTIIVARSRQSHLFGIPCESMDNYQKDLSEISDELVKNARQLFQKYSDHPAYGNEFFQSTFLNRIPQIVTAIHSSFQLLKKHSISFIILGTTEDVISRALAIVGAAKGIQSICLQHGILMGEEAFMPVFTTKVGVYGEYEKHWYIQRGVKEDCIAPIGHPKYDDIFRYTSKNKADFLRKLGLDPRKTEFIKKFGLDQKKITLLVITSTSIDNKRFKKLIENLATDPKFQIIIKPHPWEIGKNKLETYLELEKRFPTVKTYTAKGNILFEMLSHVDGVVSTMSTVVTESLLFQQPVFIYNFMISNRTYDYYDQLGEFVQTDPDQLYQLIREYYQSKKKRDTYRQIRHQYLSTTYNDGTSGKKLMDLINRLT
ncbi:CDP-glycerol glycerophosphotransferase family protein [Neobacillus sedimentimangrovi]|jgi:CDP-Glycerol:Poly(glycerophosphate) glycerophosphotransferase|uniref:CDP-glycerol glycerophosphotransferase family protein n=1 Tax=Neobacillus sedimentimangrovi TaxID=2699460 RepID=A0ABS8QFD4_9BACI|nr:CDP-glycerol glycerophosphotransferase family protein [Neobacillus sedimentimangrovi]MCD4837936.1 CDP-glycerol glycerophosphotransferase family protein [Neobacillus sedimentimangrovi]